MTIADSAYVTLSNLTLDGTGFADIFHEHHAIALERSHDLAVSGIAEQGWSGGGFVAYNTHDLELRDSSFVANGIVNVSVGYETTNVHLTGLVLRDSPGDLVLSAIPDPGAGVTTVTVDHVAISGLFPVRVRRLLVDSSAYNIVVDAITGTGCDGGARISSDSHAVTISNSDFAGNTEYGIMVWGDRRRHPRPHRAHRQHRHRQRRERIPLPLVRRECHREQLARPTEARGSGSRTARQRPGGTRQPRTAATGSHGRARTPEAPHRATPPHRTRGQGSGSRRRAPGLSASRTPSRPATAVTAWTFTRAESPSAGGHFDRNSLQGLYLRSGRANLTSVTASYNLHSGVYYGGGTRGHGDGHPGSQERLYGLAVARARASLTAAGTLLPQRRRQPLRGGLHGLGPEYASRRPSRTLGGRRCRSDASASLVLRSTVRRAARLGASSPTFLETP